MVSKVWGELVGASGETRTPTLLLVPDFESGASTNSTTEACCVFVAFLISRHFHQVQLES